MKWALIGVAIGLVAAAVPVRAQWLRIPTAGIPRTCRPTSRVIGDITVGMKRGDTVPFRPWADTLFKERLANDAKDDPTSNCIVGGVPRSDFVPYPFKILETPGIVVILYEAIHSYRQI